MFNFLRSRESREARLFLRGLKKLRRYRKDILPAKDLDQLNQSIAGLRTAIKSGDRKQMAKETEAANRLAGRIAPARPHDGWRENVEVLLVAFVIAFGIRAYYLQPFKIPTGSMQPTLNGIIGYPQPEEAPSIFVRAFERVAFGRNYINVVADRPDRLIKVREIKRYWLFTYTELNFESGNRELVQAPWRILENDFGLDINQEFEPGQTIARGYIDTGDQVFVDKMTYHFRRPHLGEVFVFKTTGIQVIEQRADFTEGAKHYIKRVAGTPRDVLRIVPPILYVNDEPAPAPGLLRVMSEDDGYAGYSNTSRKGGRFTYLGSPVATFTVPPDAYFALGDNSYNSSDSRDFGAVPEQNLVGRGFIVYWPFTSHWGWIR